MDQDVVKIGKLSREGSSERLNKRASKEVNGEIVQRR
jgi:hypothetical protein